jgi:hypothetical protein
MKISTLREFLSNLTAFVGDAKNVIVATYGKIEGYPDGLTACETKDGKHVKVISGGGMFNGVNFGFMRVLNPHPEQVQSTKDAGVTTVSNELSSVPESTFVVLYAGTSRLQKIIDLASSLAEKGAKVALLSCGCDEPERFSRIDEIPGKENIFLLMPYHPGRCDSEYEDLGEIVTTMLG